MNQKKALGRGLSALIPQKGEPVASGALAQIPLDRISASPYQPRKSFSERSIEELARSVREYGIVHAKCCCFTLCSPYKRFLPTLSGCLHFQPPGKVAFQNGE